MRQNKKAAIELSMTTIVVVVLSLSLLILGFVLIRSIMCGAIGFTGEINNQVQKEVQRLFETSEDEITCVGEGGDALLTNPGTSNVYCTIRAQSTATYRIRLKEIVPISVPKSTDFDKWIVIGNWESQVSPGFKKPIEAVTLNIPDNAPEGVIRLVMEATKNGADPVPISVDWKISRQGVVRAVLC